MGLRFRKSIKVGPARINLSKSGVGYSVGTKGFRVTKTAKGTVRTTASIPGTGISHVTETSSKKKNKSSDPNIPNNTNNSNDPKNPKDRNGLFIGLTIFFLFVFPPLGIFLLWKKTSWSKKVKTILTVVFVLYFIPYVNGVSGGLSDETIKEIQIADVGELETNEKNEVSYTITPSDLDLKNATLNAENADIASFVLEGDTLYIETKSAGTTSLWLEKDGVESNKITVSVIEPENDVAQNTEPSEPETPVVDNTEPQSPVVDNTTTTEPSTPVVEEPSTPAVEQPSTPSEPTEEMVYIAGSGEGTKYHSNPNCSNMSNPIEIPLSEAIADGYEPCKRCY